MKKVILSLWILACQLQISNGQATQWTWQTNQTSTAQRAITRGVCLDNSGNTYAAGDLNGTLYFSSTVLTGTNYDAWVAKFDQAGNILWKFKEGSTGVDKANAIAIDQAQNYIYVTGLFSGTVTFTGTGGTPVVLTSTGLDDIYLAKYNTSNGNIAWAKRAGGVFQDQGYGVAVKSNTEIFITGHAQPSTTNINFGSLNITAVNSDIMYIAKCSSSGTWLNAIAGGTGVLGTTSIGYGIAIDGSGNPYATGNANAGSTWGSIAPVGTLGVYVAKSNASLSSWTWVTTATTGSAYGITNIGSTLYITGAFSGTMNFGGTSLTSIGGTDVFFASINASTGIWGWKVRGGSTSNDFGNAISNNGSELYATGSFSDISSAPGVTATFGTTTLTTNRKNDVFVARLTTAGSINCAFDGNGNDEDDSYAIGINGKNMAIGGYTVSHDYSIGTTTATATPPVPEAIVTRFNSVSLSPLTASICPGNSVVLTAVGGGAYTWSPTSGLSPTTGSPVTASPLSSTQYTVTATPVEGCKTTAFANITVKSVCTANAGNNTEICCGPVIIGTSGSGGCTYAWTPNTGGGLTPPYNTPQIQCNLAGTYTVTVTNTASGCTSTDQVVVNYGPSCCPRLAGEADDSQVNLSSKNENQIQVTNMDESKVIKQVNVMDITGKLISKQLANSNSVTITLPLLNKGIYLVSVLFDDNSISRQKFIAGNK